MIFAVGCTEVPRNGPDYNSVRERLSDVPTSLYVRDEASFGTVTTRCRRHDGLHSGPTELTVQRGYMRVAIDENDQLEINHLQIDIAPIALDGLFDEPAELQDVHLRLSEPVRGETAWTSTDDATATLVMTFKFDWTTAFADGDAIELAPQHMPPQSLAIVLSGDGDHVSARLDLAATGELWNWADLVEITELGLSVTAETAY